MTKMSDTSNNNLPLLALVGLVGYQMMQKPKQYKKRRKGKSKYTAAQKAEYYKMKAAMLSKQVNNPNVIIK